jgi:hypothetical protein
MLQQLSGSIYPILGCDPEFFFTKKDKVIGSELLLPPEGISLTPTNTNTSKIIRDGVQAELNPLANSCRDVVCSNIGQLFIKINGEIKNNPKYKDVKVSFDTSVKVTKPAMKKLSEKSRLLGCSPSKSAYGENVDIASINTEDYRERSAGGHIHLGFGDQKLNPNPALHKALTEDAERTVIMLDIICGNTLVLVDRDKGNAKRRLVYGRAGEYRTPAHGLEYRTPSNFWLKSKPLASLTFGLARLAVHLMTDKNKEVYFKAFTEAVNVKNVQDAINLNSFQAAMRNFKAIEPLLMQVMDKSGTEGRHPITPNNIKYFYAFIEGVKQKGLEFWLPENPMEHWERNYSSSYYKGFNDFLLTHVKPIVDAGK